jgi:primase-polymerase (primpol)-like protein
LYVITTHDQMSTPPTADALPAALIDREQWVCWRTQERDGNATKVPIIPGSTQFASTTDPDTWRSFTAAREAATELPVDGVGFVFTSDDPLVGIDLDDCRDPDTATPATWAADVIETLESYTEVSPSGTGYHVLVTGELPDGRNRAGDLEVYDRSRFFTVTGAHVGTTPETVAARGDALATLVEQELSAESPATADAEAAVDSSPTDATTATADTSTQDAAVPIPDAELLERAQNAANGDKFSRLWNGSTSGYESHSEADLALCRMLAFWTGRDVARVDRLFRRSDLYREKWDAVHYADGSTYGEKTVERAVAATDDVYTPPAASVSTAASEPRPAGASAETGDAASPAATVEEEPTAEAAGTADDPPADLDGDVAPPPVEQSELPPTHPERAQARRDRIAELTARVETLLEENERLRAELATERERRRELEPADEGSARGWWPFSTE